MILNLKTVKINLITNIRVQFHCAWMCTMYWALNNSTKLKCSLEPAPKKLNRKPAANESNL